LRWDGGTRPVAGGRRAPRIPESQLGVHRIAPCLPRRPRLSTARARNDAEGCCRSRTTLFIDHRSTHPLVVGREIRVGTRLRPRGPDPGRTGPRRVKNGSRSRPDFGGMAPNAVVDDPPSKEIDPFSPSARGVAHPDRPGGARPGALDGPGSAFIQPGFRNLVVRCGRGESSRGRSL